MPKKENKPKSTDRTIMGLSYPAAGGIAVFVVMVIYVLGTAMMTPVPVRGVPKAPAPATAPAPEVAAAASPPPVVIPPDAGPEMSRYDPGVPLITHDVKLTRAAFEATSRLIDNRDAGDIKSLFYQLRLPQDWVQSMMATPNQVKGSSRYEGVLSAYTGPMRQGHQSSVKVMAQVIDYLADIRDIAEQYAKENQFVIQSIGRVNDDRAEMMYVVADGDVSYVARAVLVRNGRQLLVATYTMAQESYEAERDQQIWVITSFYPTFKDLTPPEEMASTPLILVDGRSLSFPAAWTEDNCRLPVGAMWSCGLVRLEGATESDPRGILRGRVDIVTMAIDTPWQDAVVAMNTRLTKHNLVIADPVGYWPGGQKNPALTRLYQVKDKDGKVTDDLYYLTTVPSGMSVFYVGLLTSRNGTLTEQAVRNQATYDAIIHGLAVSTP